MRASVSQSRAVAAVAVLAVVLGVVTGIAPMFGAVFILAALFAGLFFTVERSILPIVSLGILLAIPLDFIGPFSQDLRGLPVLGVAVGGALLAVLSHRRPLGQLVSSSWDVMVFSAALILAFSINGVEGGLRQALMLVAGVLFYFWARASHEPGSDTRPTSVRMLLYVGIFQGAASAAERPLGPGAFASLVPTYAPAFKEFSLVLGSRATAFAGHPLRLGALEMSGLIAGIGLMRGTQAGTGCRVGLYRCVRAWPAAQRGTRGVARGTGRRDRATCHHPGRRVTQSRFAAGRGIRVGWIALDSLGVVGIVQERLFGSASRPASVAQRIGVLASTFEISRRRPLVGYGFGTYLEEIYAQGFRFSNTENEYINFVLSGGSFSVQRLADGRPRHRAGVADP